MHACFQAVIQQEYTQERKYKYIMQHYLEKKHINDSK